MELLDSHQIGRGLIELLKGDLTEVPVHHRVDLLVISAFPNDYVPTNSSLVGALHRKGLSVRDLARSKEEDLRENFSCWLSQTFDPPDPGLGFRRVLCFEPLTRGEAPELVGDIYRALVPLLARDPGIKSVALPVVAAGDQRYSVDRMLALLLEATFHWLESGLPIDQVKIVAFSDSDAEKARDVFARSKASYSPGGSLEKPSEYDVFISYAHENVQQMQELEFQLLNLAPAIKVFIDRNSIDIGTPWQPQIFESLDFCRKVVPLFSPAYLTSKVCKEEFNIAWVRSREREEEILFPIYLFTAALPTYMRYRSYFDCREGDAAKLREASRHLIQNLDLLALRSSSPETC